MSGDGLAALLHGTVAQARAGELVECHGAVERLAEVAELGEGRRRTIDHRGVVAVRVLTPTGAGFAYTADWSAPGLRAALAAARGLTAARSHPGELPEPPAALPPDDGSWDGEDGEPVDALVDAARAVPGAASMRVRVRRRRAVVLHAHHLGGGDRPAVGSYRSVSTSATVGLGPATGTAWARALTAAQVGGLVQRTLRRSGESRAWSLRGTPVVFEGPAAAAVIEMLGRALEEAAHGRGVLARHLDRPLVSPHLVLVDDGRRTDGPAAGPFDGEGTATGRTVLTEGGTLVRLLHDRYTGPRAGTASTGNARRFDLAAPPRVAPSNLTLEPHPGGADPAGCLDAVVRGFHCDTMMGTVANLDLDTGRIAVPAQGHLIRHGEPGRRVHGVLQAELIPLLRSITAVAPHGELLPFEYGVGTATLLADGAVSLQGG